MDMYIAICTLQVSGITPIPCTWIISKYKTVPSDQRDALILISAVVRAVVRAVVNVVELGPLLMLLLGLLNPQTLPQNQTEGLPTPVPDSQQTDSPNLDPARPQTVPVDLYQPRPSQTPDSPSRPQTVPA